MSGISPLRLLYNSLSNQLSEYEERQLRNLLSNVQIASGQMEKLKSSAEIFIKLEESDRISETNLKLLKDLLGAIGRPPLVSEVEKVEKELQRLCLERVSDESKVKNTDIQSSVGGDVTASSEISSDAVHIEMTRTMEDSEGDPTSLQHHIDKHSLRQAQYAQATNVQPQLQLEVQEQTGCNSDIQSSVGGDVTASSEIRSDAVHIEVTRTMENPEGDPTSLQHHIDKHSLRHAQYAQATNVQPQLQLEVQEQTGYNSGSTPSNRRNGSAESACITESEYPDVVLRCERDLKSLYVKLSEILPFPWWDGTNRLKLENVYTELELETKKGEKQDFPKREIFSSKKGEESQKAPKRVLIEGDPGYGKSIFCKQLIYDWANGDADYFKCFMLVFYFELRDLLHSNAQNIQDAIFNQLLKGVSDEGERLELWNFVQNNQEKVCFVFDGLDEVPTKDLPPYFRDMIAVNGLLPDCPVVVTSRKIRDKNSKQMYDTQLSIKGFDYEKAKLFIEKHMDEMNSQGTAVKASDFLQELEKSNHKHVLIDFMQSPLNTLMLCDIWIHSNKLPNTRTQLYEEIIDYVVKRYKENHHCNSHIEEEINQALFLIGEMSYRGLTTDERKVYFSEEDISHNRYILEIGLLTKVSEFPSQYGFYHLTFQEYFASMYVAHLLTNDRDKFIDAITLLSEGRDLGCNSTLYAFLGGKLQNNVDEIFKAMQEKGILQDRYGFFDLREILYESCCTSVAVFEHCAEFLPEDLTIDFNTMVSHSDSNRLSVNTAILQCQRTRSKRIMFKLSVVNADTVAMYRECYEALQKNGKKFDSIDLRLTIDLNDCKCKGRGYVDDFTVISDTHSHSSQNLKPLKIHWITIEICKRVKSPIALTDRRHLITIIKDLLLLSADSLYINDLPVGNFEFVKDVIDSLSRNKIRYCISVTFCDDCTENCQKTLSSIVAKFKKFSIHLKMNKMEFNLVDLYNCLSTFLSDDDKNLLKFGIDLNINFHTSIISDVHNVLHRLGSVDIERLSLEIEGSSGLNKKDIYPSISAIVEATSQVSAKSFDIQGLPSGNLDLMREVLNYLNRNKLIRCISMTFGKRHALNIRARFGKFDIDYNSEAVEFNLEYLHRMLSSIVVENASVKLDVEINSGLRKTPKSVMVDILRRLQSTDIRILTFNITDSRESPPHLKKESLRDMWLNEEDECAHIVTTVNELSHVSARELYIENLPLGNIEFMKNVLGCLRNGQRRDIVSLTFCENYLDIDPSHALQMQVNFGKFKVCYGMYTMDFKLADLHVLFPTSVSGNKRELPDVSFTYYLKRGRKLDITDMLCKLESVEIGQLLLKIKTIFINNLQRQELCSITSMVTALSQVSANKLVVEELPIVNLEFMRNVLDCLSSCKLPKTVHITFCDDGLASGDTGKLEMYARFGKFQLLWKMNKIDFNLLSLRKSLTQCFSLDDNGVTFTVRVNYDLKESTYTKLTEIFEKLVSVNIAKISLHMSNVTYIGSEDIYSHTSHMLQSLSLINAKSFVIEGLPCRDIEFIKSVHTDLEKSLPDKVTHIFFEPTCFQECELKFFEYTTVTAKNQKHNREFGICKSKIDIVSLYQELQERLSAHNQKFLMNAKIKYTSLNIEDDIQYILDGSKSITFNKIEYVEGSDNESPAIDVLEKLAEVNTEQFSYKSNKYFGYESTKSVIDAMLQCQSAQTFVISSVQQCDDIEISENIKKLVRNGIIIREVKLFGRKVVIQGTYAKGTNTRSKVIEVKFTWNHNLDSDLSYDYTAVNGAILDDSTAFTNVYVKMFDSLQTISELESLCVELPIILSTAFQTFHTCEITIENILDFVVALPYLTSVSIVGGKITSTDNSSEKWTDLCSKESLQMLTFEGCDLNSSCQSVIDSFNKVDERRSSKLSIILRYSLCSENMKLMKGKLLSKSFGLHGTHGQDTQGDITLYLEGKSVSIRVFSCPKQDVTYKPLLKRLWEFFVKFVNYKP